MSTIHLAQHPLTNVLCSGGSSSFAKETRALKMRIVASHWKLTMTNGEHHLSWFSYNYERSLKNSTSTILGSADIWSKLERRKGLSGSLMSWPKKKKIVGLKCCRLLFYTTTYEPLLNWIVIYEKKRILYDDQLCGWTEKLQALPKGKLAAKVPVTVWWSDASLIYYSFLNPRETITSEKYAQQIDEMHPKLETRIGQQQYGPSSSHNNAQPHIAQPNFQKLNELGHIQSFVSSAVFTWTFANWLLLQISQQLFAGQKLPQPAGGRKCFQRICWNLKHNFYTAGVNISHW